MKLQLKILAIEIKFGFLVSTHKIDLGFKFNIFLRF